MWLTFGKVENAGFMGGYGYMQVSATSHSRLFHSECFIFSCRRPGGVSVRSRDVEAHKEGGHCWKVRNAVWRVSAEAD